MGPVMYFAAVTKKFAKAPGPEWCFTDPSPLSGIGSGCAAFRRQHIDPSSLRPPSLSSLLRLFSTRHSMCLWRSIILGNWCQEPLCEGEISHSHKGNKYRALQKVL